MRNPLLLVVGVAMGVSMLYFWYCEMFSDGYIGWFERFFNRIRWRGKNFTALSEPAAGLTACFGCIAALGTVIDPNIFRRGREAFRSGRYGPYSGAFQQCCARSSSSLASSRSLCLSGCTRSTTRRSGRSSADGRLPSAGRLWTATRSWTTTACTPHNWATSPSTRLRQWACPPQAIPRPSRARPKQRTRPSTTPAPLPLSTSPPLPPHCPAPGRPPAAGSAPSEPRAPAGADRRVATHRRRATPRTNLTAPTKRSIRRRLRRPRQCHLRNRHRQSHRRHVWIIPRQAWREPDQSVGNRFRPWDINLVA